MRLLLTAWAAIAVSACCIQLPQPIVRPDPTNGPSVPTGASQWPAGALLLGSSEGGASDFTPIGSTVQMVAGSQGGGRHVYLSFRVVGQTPTSELFILARANRVSDGKFVGSSEQPVGFNAVDAGTSDANFSFRLVLCPTPAGLNIVDQDLTIEAYAFSRQGGTFLGKASATAKAQCSGCQPECGG